jgi:hypothetical protein
MVLNTMNMNYWPLGDFINTATQFCHPTEVDSSMTEYLKHALSDSNRCWSIYEVRMAAMSIFKNSSFWWWKWSIILDDIIYSSYEIAPTTNCSREVNKTFLFGPLANLLRQSMEQGMNAIDNLPTDETLGGRGSKTIVAD